jgi:hypothetical protein
MIKYFTIYYSLSPTCLSLINLAKKELRESQGRGKKVVRIKIINASKYLIYTFINITE